ncbi:MAG: helix-turn-helix domain-containing protein [Gaiellaceae bacterium]|jgi:orotate phosphoribosyltransferase-like protein
MKPLTETQLKCCQLTARGLSQPQVATVLDVSHSTVTRTLRREDAKEEVTRWKNRLFGKTDDLEWLEEMVHDGDPRVAIAALVLKDKLGLFSKGGGDDAELPDGAYIVFREPRVEDEWPLQTTAT